MIFVPINKILTEGIDKEAAKVIKISFPRKIYLFLRGMLSIHWNDSPYWSGMK